MVTQVALTPRERDQYAELARGEFRKLRISDMKEAPEFVDAMLRVIENREIPDKTLRKSVRSFRAFMSDFRAGQYTLPEKYQAASEVFKFTVANPQNDEGLIREAFPDSKRKKVADQQELDKTRLRGIKNPDEATNGEDAIQDKLIATGLSESDPLKMNLILQNTRAVSCLLEVGVSMVSLSVTQQQTLSRILSNYKLAKELIRDGCKWDEVVKLVEAYIPLHRFIKLFRSSYDLYNKWREEQKDPAERERLWALLKTSLDKYPMGLLRLWEEAVELIDVIVLPDAKREQILKNGEIIADMMDVTSFDVISEIITKEWFTAFLSLEEEKKEASIEELLNSISSADLLDALSLEVFFLAHTGEES